MLINHGEFIKRRFPFELYFLMKFNITFKECEDICLIIARQNFITLPNEIAFFVFETEK